MSDFRAVTVPCPSCKAEVGFPGRVCSKCNAPLPKDRRDALTTRLASASEEFRDLLENEQRASTILLILALTHVVLGAMTCVFQLQGDVLSPSEKAAVLDLFSVDLAIGASLFGCYVWSKRAPVPAIATALALWIGTHLLFERISPLVPTMIGIAPLALVRVIVSRLFVLILLVRGLFSSLKAARIRRSLESS